jgi:hypothetical protein
MFLILFDFNYSALLSMGLSGSTLSGLRYALPKLINGITKQLFLDDKKIFLDKYFSYNENEFIGCFEKLKCKI